MNEYMYKRKNERINLINIGLSQDNLPSVWGVSHDTSLSKKYDSNRMRSKILLLNLGDSTQYCIFTGGRRRHMMFLKPEHRERQYVISGVWVILFRHGDIEQQLC